MKGNKLTQEVPEGEKEAVGSETLHRQWKVTSLTG